MVALKDILYKVSLLEVAGSTDLEVRAITMDSRKVQPGVTFVAVSGTQVDGHDYIEKAVELGATAVVCENMPEVFADNVTYVVVASSAIALGVMASNFYGKPSSKLKLVGVTGTNGKTTTVTLLFSLFRALGYNTGLLSTVENKINESVIPSTHTTPDAVELNALLAEMVDHGCTHCFMEVSSHAVVQQRIAGLEFAGGMFTNISHDHLDYHKTFDEYIKAKKGFFDALPASAFALSNGDDKRGTVMLQNSKADKKYYGLKSLTDFKGKVLENTLQGLEMTIDQYTAWFKLIGRFNAYNLLGAYAIGVLLGEDQEEVLTNLSMLDPVSGRFQQIISGSGIIGIVDYAHTPDALENVLNTINELKEGNASVITVVGCGGNRDKAKRPKMAEIACKLSDRVILTSDNPRNEVPSAIIEDMKKGVSPTYVRKTLVMEDRREAIKMACALAESNDIILLAGKGHEAYQEVNGVKHHFDDREELVGMLKLMEK